MPSLPYPVYDADHHLYEPQDAFQRYLPKEFEKDFYFVDVKGRTKVVINGVLSEYIPNPTFAVVAAPGSHEKWYRHKNPEGLTMRQLAGKAIRPPEEWRSGEGRLKVMDQQGIHAALIFPTLASAIEARLGDKPETMAALFTALNRWMVDEWGFNRGGRVFGVPMIGLADIDAAVVELETVLKAGARCVGIRPAPVPGLRGSRSFGLREFDPFWARCAEANIFVCLHTSDSGYSQINEWWLGGAAGGEYLPFERNAFSIMLEPLARPIMDSLAALICHGVPDRHPNLRIACVENGAEWVEPLLRRFDQAYGSLPIDFKRHPRDTFHKHIFVAPFYEDDMRAIAKAMPVERILFGSDFPHPEGLAEPLDYIKEFAGFKDEDIKKIFHSNLKGLLEGVRN